MGEQVPEAVLRLRRTGDEPRSPGEDGEDDVDAGLLKAFEEGVLLIEGIIKNEAIQLKVEMRVHQKAGACNGVPALVENVEVEMAGRARGVSVVEVDVAK